MSPFIALRHTRGEKREILSSDDMLRYRAPEIENYVTMEKRVAGIKWTIGNLTELGGAQRPTEAKTPLL